MISKRIPCRQENDNFRRLANYIADASGGEKYHVIEPDKHLADYIADKTGAGEKCLMTWAAGCDAGQDYDLAIDEIRATQAMNTRSTKEKSYHLVVSFHKEDMARLTSKEFKEIEEEVAKALGFESHQRLCGIHINTDNPHMHVAYNMIHKEKFTRHDPFYDYYKRDQICRQLEKKYNLKVDPGIEQQFADYIKQKETYIRDALSKASSWEELHKSLAIHGLVTQKRGNGLVIAAIGHKQSKGFHVKMSDLGKEFSKQKLEKRLGAFTQTNGEHEIKEVFQRIPKNSKSSDFEAKTGRKSFESYVKENLSLIKQAADRAVTWQELHQELASIGMEIKPRGAGYVLSDMTKKNVRVPFSLTTLRIAKLEKKLGTFELSSGYAIKRRYKPTKTKSLPGRRRRKTALKKFSEQVEEFFEEE